jgi:ribosomal protein L11 methyltransferase
VRLPKAAVPRAEALLELAGAAALSFDDGGDDPVLEPAPGATPLWPTVVVRALFRADTDLAPLEPLLADSCGVTSFAIEPLAPEQWQAAARRAPTQRRIGTRLWLSDANAPPTQDATASVRLHMGLAFGTGEHPTTALCLEWLEARLDHGARVLDYGCGCGVLAIAALALGASAAWAVDHDAQALTATADNALLNGVAGRLWIGLPAALPTVTVDVVVANILARPLVELAPALSACTAPGGAVVLAGVLDTQRADVVRAYERSFDELEFAEREGWVRIAGRRRPG